MRDCFFFFKQKTAYEMRISDWSSDVCSSDLEALELVSSLLSKSRRVRMAGTPPKRCSRLKYKYPRKNLASAPYRSFAAWDIGASSINSRISLALLIP